MSTNLVIGPVMIPLATAIVLIIFNRRLLAQKIISVISVLATLIYACNLLYRVSDGTILLFYASNWVPPFGIAMVIDMLSALMVTASAILGFVCMIYSLSTMDEGRLKNFYLPLYQMFFVGINGSLITGDIFNLFVFFEIMLMSSYVLLVLGSDRGQLREGFKYLIINIVSSSFFLVALGVVYSLAGTMNMADLAVKLPQAANQGLVTMSAMLFLLVFGVKAAIFPLYFWLPNSYHQPPPAISAIFGGLLTKVGVYVLIRIFTLIFIGDVAFTHSILFVLGVLTMIFGVVITISQTDFRLILSYHIISQVGYMVMGLGMFSVLSVAGAIFHMLHNIIVKTGLFLASGITQEVTGTTDLHKMGGLLHRYPWLGWTFFITAMALAGVPPLSGFFSKFMLIQAGAELGNYYSIAAVLGVGFLTMFSMIKIFLYAFWGEEKPVLDRPNFDYKKIMPASLILCGISVCIGLGASYVCDFVMLAAEQLMNPQLYIDTVLFAFI